eukprot:1245797-Amphidinium_carterae.2
MIACVCVPQEDVMSLKQALTKTSKCIVQVVATSLDACPWWHNMIQEYLTKAAATMEQRGTIDRLRRELAEMVEVTELHCQTFMGLFRAVPTLLNVTRAGASQQYLQELLQKVSLLWTHIKSKPGHEWSCETIDSFLAVFSEAVSVWPMEMKFHEYMEEMASLKQENAALEMMRDVLKAATLLLQTTQTEHEPFMEKVTPLLQKVAPTCTPHGLKDSSKEILLKVIEHIYGFMNLMWGSTTMKLEAMGECAECAHGAASILQVKAVLSATTHVLDAVHMAKSYDVLIKEPEGCEANQTLKDIIALQRRLDVIVDPHGSHGLTQDIFDKVGTFKEVALEKVKQTKLSLLTKYESVLKGKMAELKDIHLGMPGGLSWLQGFQGDSFDQLLEHATSTLLSQSGTTLSTCIKNLDEAKLMSP